MERVLIVSKDRRLASQIKSWLSQLAVETAADDVGDFAVFIEQAKVAIKDRLAHAPAQAPPIVEERAQGPPPDLAEAPTENRDAHSGAHSEEHSERDGESNAGPGELSRDPAAVAAGGGSSEAATEPEANPPAEPQRARGGPTYSLVILDHPAGFLTGARWVDKIKNSLAEAGLSDPSHPPLVFLIAPEDAVHTPESFAASGADDLIMKPLDHSLFLQKTEILFARGESFSPSFLFRLKTEEQIAIAKDCLIDEYSEVEVFIRNPLAIRPGAFAHLHSELFGSGQDARVTVRVMESLPAIGDERNPFRIRLRLFGLRSVQLANIRRTMRSGSAAGGRSSKGSNSQAPSRKATTSASKGPSGPMGIAKGLVEEGPTGPSMRVAFVDLDPGTAPFFKTLIEDDLHGLDTVEFRGWARLVAALRVFSSATEEASSPPGGSPPGAADGVGSVNRQGLTEAAASAQSPAEPRNSGAKPSEGAGNVAGGDLGSGTNSPTDAASSGPILPTDREVNLIVRGDDGLFLRFEPALEDDVFLLGASAASFRDRPDLLRSGVHPDDQGEFDDMLAFVSTGALSENTIRLRCADGRTTALKIRGERVKASEGPDPAILSLNLKEVGEDERATRGALKRDDLKFDLIVVDAAFLSSDPANRVRLLRDEFVRAGVAASVEEAPRILVLAKEESGVRPETFRVDGVEHFVWRDQERKFLTDTFLSLVAPQFLKETAATAKRIAARIQGHLARDTRFEEISEFGVSIQTNAALKPGTILRFFSPILGRMEHGVLARCISAREAEGGFINEFVFFGSSDEFQKRIRAYVRQEHARRKAREAG